MKLQYNGSDYTMVRVQAGGEKVEVKPKDIFEVNDERAKELLRYSSDFQVVAGVVAPEKVAKAEVAPKVEEMDKLDKEDEITPRVEVTKSINNKK